MFLNLFFIFYCPGTYNCDAPLILVKSIFKETRYYENLFFTFLCLLHFFVGVSALFSCLLYLCLCLPNFFCVYLTFFLSTLPFLFLCNLFCVYLTFFCFYLTFFVSTSPYLCLLHLICVFFTLFVSNSPYLCLLHLICV